ncbi:hypothetical protein EYF80_058985 [Liparis tanakae]|uniref:Uncharacterized protein n=1 Tax=Liparis tanakae TaxID=230148 RepID=A0A4Z2EPZ4_9TELE|nr:hypothetical protein EYF80_058985 [Liparis tanakae]
MTLPCIFAVSMRLFSFMPLVSSPSLRRFPSPALPPLSGSEPVRKWPVPTRRIRTSEEPEGRLDL